MIAFTTFIKIREHLGLSQQDIAQIAGVDVGLVEQYEKGEISREHEKIDRALFKIVAQRYPEKVKAAVDPVLELAKTYPEGSMMREFLNSTENFLKP
jgi:transcriptional regulator with XRE-family HTH domain